LGSSPNEQGKPNTPDGVTAGGREKVKPSRDRQRVEPFAALDRVTVLERGHGSVLIHAQKRLEYLLARGKTSPASQFFKE